ncbi:MAG: hypothetical protein PHY08_11175, partial [Candidatus Cloacimonetes bacterium]|nr:hypothetical protein [Candidatus Cloacimonadota bacterium]
MEKANSVNKSGVKFLEKLGFLGFSTSTNIAFNFKNLFYLTFLTMVLHIDILMATIMVTIIEALRKKVASKGLATPEMAAEMTKPELLEFLFLPSF